jgi:hypothetical protein
MASNPQLEGPAGRPARHALQHQDGVTSKPSWGVRFLLLVLRFVEYRLQQHSSNDADPLPSLADHAGKAYRVRTPPVRLQHPQPSRVRKHHGFKKFRGHLRADANL